MSAGICGRPRSARRPPGSKRRVGTGRFNDRRHESGQRGSDVVQRQRFQSVLSQEGLPLHLLVRILRKGIGDPEWSPSRQDGLAVVEGGLNCLAENVAIKAGMPRQYPEIEVILHAAVGYAKG